MTHGESACALVALHELMATADFVSIHCPLTDQTRNLIGAQELALMKASSYLINTARGGIVDEDALFDVVRESRIAGAAIDCFALEPVIAPHRFGRSTMCCWRPTALPGPTSCFATSAARRARGSSP